MSENLLTPTVANEGRKLDDVARYGEQIAAHTMWNLFVHGGQLVFAPSPRLTHTITRDMPEGVPRGELVKYLNSLPAGAGFPENLVPFIPDEGIQFHDWKPLVRRGVSGGSATCTSERKLLSRMQY